MKASKMLAPTLREVPAEAEIISHKLMLRAGMMRKVASGVYTYLPLAWRSIRKIEQIIREEMDAKGGQELLMPAVQPAEIWQESGRWGVYGAELWRVKDRNGRDFCLGPTHEELISVTVRGDVRSYKQLPLLLYQIQTKYRDERRPRFGLMRSREFIMKDLYSFDIDEAGLSESYDKMYDAYSRVFTRCGLNFRPVEADTGAIGGKGSHEFMALAEAGESAILYCDTCDYAATDEIAGRDPLPVTLEEMLPIEKVDTPDCGTVEDVAKFLNVPASRIVKTMYYQADGELVIVLIRGDRRINEIKLQGLLGCNELALADNAEIEQNGSKVGYLGPVGVENIKILADAEVPLMFNVIVGANDGERHLLNVNFQRGDFRIDQTADLRYLEEGEQCPHCGGHLKLARGIEVGQIFKLRTKYSESLHVNYTAEDGAEHPMVMGCYGIGVGRTLAAVIEQSHDSDGIIWPVAVAPYHVVIIPVNDREQELVDTANKLYDEISAAGLEAVLDDRGERAGVKFKDADLIGYPVRITVGAKSLARGCVEVKIRKTGEMQEIPVGDVTAWLKDFVRQSLANG
ncbi:MAG TPA: proline--tRNA ligase [Candidatus Avidehalobacter gallistercoris]|uniref:Proline--tRNA ligase n=1 Tax=Candidatus Avidehalobacter gallistercoris TaxID=2840694 RepID=A0A9D1HKK5_9FIRM|nr:proline--tRNA ligase [Candidatus Avidehalobacter gallistercoris]